MVGTPQTVNYERAGPPPSLSSYPLCPPQCPVEEVFNEYVGRREPGREGVLQSKNYYYILQMGEVKLSEGKPIGQGQTGHDAELG